jgi:hypothetical protein
MLDGQIPYRDFYGGSKPPLYNFMLFIMGYAVTPGQLQFRAVFSVFDALIPILIFLICAQKYDERHGVIGGLIYSLFPINIICVGLSGHYDPVVVVFTLASLLWLFRNKMNLSALSLGIAFALKFYPFVFLPFFLTTMRTTKDRIWYVFYFLMPTILANGVLFLMSPEAFFEYLSDESQWMGFTSFAETLEMMLGTSVIVFIKITWLVLAVFGFLIFALFLEWLSPNRRENIVKWHKVVISVFVVYYGFYIMHGVLFYGGPLYLALIVGIVFFTLMVFLLGKYIDRLTPTAVVNSDSEMLIIYTMYATIFFLIGLPNIAPWYFVWFFPFLLIIRTDRIRYSLLWIFPWHGVGENMRFIPGTGKLN